MFQGISLVDLTAPTLLGLTVILILTGGLVTRSQLKDKERQIQDWKEAYKKSEEARVRSDSQTSELLEVSKTSNAILVAMFGPAGVIRRSGGPDATSKKA